MHVLLKDLIWPRSTWLYCFFLFLVKELYCFFFFFFRERIVLLLLEFFAICLEPRTSEEPLRNLTLWNQESWHFGMGLSFYFFISLDDVWVWPIVPSHCFTFMLSSLMAGRSNSFKGPTSNNQPLFGSLEWSLY